MRLARCTERGCPVVYRDGLDRPCPMHASDEGDTLAARMEAFAALSAVPGERAGGDGNGDGPTGEREGGRRTEGG